MRIDSGVFDFSGNIFEAETILEVDSIAPDLVLDSFKNGNNSKSQTQFPVSEKSIQPEELETINQKTYSFQDFYSIQNFDSFTQKNQTLDLSDQVPEDSVSMLKNRTESNSEIPIDSQNLLSKLFKKQDFESSNDWIIGVILVSFVVLAWIKVFYKKFISRIILSGFEYQTAYKLYHEKSSLTTKISSVLYLIYIINFGLFLTLLFNYYDFSPFANNFLLFLTLCGIISIFDIFKVFIYKLLGYLFKSKNQFSEFLFNDFIFNKSFAIFLYPIIISIPFMPELFSKYLVYIGIALMIIFYILHIFRGLKIFVKKHFYFSYMILYLCTLEILPLLIILKYLNALL